MEIDEGKQDSARTGNEGCQCREGDGEEVNGEETKQRRLQAWRWRLRSENMDRGTESEA